MIRDGSTAEWHSAAGSVRIPVHTGSALALALCLIFCPAFGPPAVQAEAAPHGPRIEPYILTAPDGREIRGDLYRIEVPENRTTAVSSTIELAFVRFPALVPQPGPPVLYLAGGPGNSGIKAGDGPRWALFEALREIADVVLLDQRGTGLSSPNLLCPQAWSRPREEPLEIQGLSAAIHKQATSCARRLAARNIDLSAYNAREIADDVEAVRKALGTPRIHLLAISYGTHLALGVLRRHGPSVGRAVLAGVVGPDHTYRLPRGIERSLAAINDGDLLQRIEALAGRLDSKPVTIKAWDPFGKREVDVVVGKFDLLFATLRRLTDRQHLTDLASAYREMEQGDFSRLSAGLLAGKRGWLGLAMPYAVSCASGASSARGRRLAGETEEALFGRLANFPFPEICQALGTSDLGEAWRAAVRSEVPTLFISGALDVRTPARNAEEVIQGFDHGRHLILEEAGHGEDLLLAPETVSRIVHFFQGQLFQGPSPP